MRLAILFAAYSGLLCAQDLAARMDEAVKSIADSNRKFMGSVLVARGGEKIISRGYGFANLEWDIPNTPDTKFRLGSISKQFTAACILILEQQGKLKVTDPVRKYLDDAPAAWDNITIHHVLTHTSGIPSFTSFPEYHTIKLQPTTLQKSYSLYRDKPLEFEPGASWNYSNSGYLLLSYLVEKISGQKYDEFLKNYVLQPSGMRDSGCDLNATILKRRASGYTAMGTILLNADYINMTIPSGAGALYSTVEDLLRWETALFGGKVVSEESLKEMTTPFLKDYAYGLVLHQTGNHKSFGHGGGIEGFNTDLRYFPDDKLVVVVLGNLNGNAPPQIADRLAALALENAKR